MSQQKTFNLMDCFFEFTDDGWYTWEFSKAKKAALQARNSEVKRLRKSRMTVKVFTLSNQLCSRGGIGSGNPHIEQWVSIYGLNAW